MGWTDRQTDRELTMFVSSADFSDKMEGTGNILVAQKDNRPIQSNPINAGNKQS